MKIKSYALMLSGLALVSLSLSGCPFTWVTPSDTYSVTYYGNGQTGGEVPVDSKSYEYGDSATVLEGIPVKMEYTFLGWEYRYGALCYAGETLYVDSNLQLQAKWRFNGKLFTTKEENGELTITAYNGEGGILAVPARIDDKPVLRIGDDAFSVANMPLWYIHEVTLPEGIVSIGERAFYLNGLTSFKVPNSVISIGANAFTHNNLTRLTLGSGLQSIGEYAFDSNGLTSITLPAGVSVGAGAFKDNPLVDISIGSNVAIGDDQTFGQYGKAFRKY
jgi:acetyltransferase-like isoleucine patch superfamily enzyme